MSETKETGLKKDQYGRVEVNMFGIKYMSNGKPKGAPFRWDGNYQSDPNFYRNMIIELTVIILVSILIGFIFG